MFDGEWQIVCEQRHIERYRSERGFQRLVALARILNQLRFAQMALPAVQDDDSPSGKRQRINSFFLTAALLSEGMGLAQRLAQDYRERESFQQGLGSLLRDKGVEDLLSQYIKPLRNEAVFHADEDQIEGRLAQYTADPVVFASGSGTGSGYSYYDLGDIMAMMAFVGDAGDDDSFIEQARSLMQRTTSLAINFLGAGDKLIADVLHAYGFTAKTVGK